MVIVSLFLSLKDSQSCVRLLWALFAMGLQGCLKALNLVLALWLSQHVCCILTKHRGHSVSYRRGAGGED